MWLFVYPRSVLSGKRQCLDVSDCVLFESMYKRTRCSSMCCLVVKTPLLELEFEWLWIKSLSLFQKIDVDAAEAVADAVVKRDPNGTIVDEDRIQICNIPNFFGYKQFKKFLEKWVFSCAYLPIFHLNRRWGCIGISVHLDLRFSSRNEFGDLY